MKEPENHARSPEDGATAAGEVTRGASLSRETLEGARRREPEALSEFFESLFDRTYALAYRLLGNRTTAEDALQEVFLRVHRSVHKLDPERDPSPWITTITYNVCRDHWRSFSAKLAGRSISLDDEPGLGERIANGGPTPETDVLTAERERFVQQAILQLPEDMREIVVLRDYEGLDHERIAALVGAGGPAVRKRYSRALARLAELLKDVVE